MLGYWQDLVAVVLEKSQRSCSGDILGLYLHRLLLLGPVLLQEQLLQPWGWNQFVSLKKGKLLQMFSFAPSLSCNNSALKNRLCA